MNIVNFRKIFHYRDGVEYYIPLNNIEINYEFQLKSPRYSKFRSKEKNFLKDGSIGKIILNHNFELADGYCSYLIYKKHGVNKVPVYFSE